MPSDFEINQALQSEMKRRCMASLTAVKAAALLEEMGVLPDSPDRPGRELRRRLRAGKITGSRQISNGHWYIDCLQPPAAE